MAELKTKPTNASVEKFIRSIEDDRRRKECRTLVKVMKEITGEKPKMWGPAMVGFGSYRYKYASGREGEWFVAGFAPRKTALTLYIMSGFPKHAALLRKLGKFKTGKACLYVKRLDDVDMDVLTELVERSVEVLQTAGPNYA